MKTLFIIGLSLIALWIFTFLVAVFTVGAMAHFNQVKEKERMK